MLLKILLLIQHLQASGKLMFYRSDLNFLFCLKDSSKHLNSLLASKFIESSFPIGIVSKCSFFATILQALDHHYSFSTFISVVAVGKPDPLWLTYAQSIVLHLQREKKTFKFSFCSFLEYNFRCNWKQFIILIPQKFRIRAIFKWTKTFFVLQRQ